MVEADIVMQDGTLASWINSEKTTFDGKVFHPIEETYSTGKSGKFIYVERYSEDILTDGTAKVHLIVEAGKDPGTGVGLDDAGSIAEFAFDFIVDAKALEAKTRTQELDIEIPMPKFPSGKMRLQMQEAVLNTLILQQLMMQSVSLCVMQKVLQKTMMNVWDTARCFWKEVWSMEWKQKICGLTRYSWL